MNIPKEVLMKLDKEELVNIIANLSEANEKLSRSTGSILENIKFGYPKFGYPNKNNIENELNIIRKEIEHIRETCETETEFENKLKAYFDSVK